MGNLCFRSVGENVSGCKPFAHDEIVFAVLDVIIIKMALVEFLYFPTIPTKVTLDEYVDISKEYSTPKSKDFVNGILDKLMKNLAEEGKIKKEGRGLLEE